MALNSLILVLMAPLLAGPPSKHPGAIPVDPAPATAPAPDTVVAPPGGPNVVVRSQSASPVTAIRVLVPLPDVEGSDGGRREVSVEVLRRAGLERARSEAERLGARVDGGRTSTGIAYTVAGSYAELDHLVAVLQEALARPEPTDVESAAQSLLDALEETQETPEGLLRERLRSQALGAPDPDETRSLLHGLRYDAVEEVWAESHRREDLEVVVVGPGGLETLLASIRPLGQEGAPAVEGGVMGSPSAEAPDNLQALRHWHGMAHVGPAGDVRWSVAAALISRRARADDTPYELGVEVVEAGGRAALLVMGAAYPADAGALERRLDGLAEELVETLSAEEVAAVRDELRADWVARMGAPWGLAEFMGSLREDPQGGESVEEALEALAEMDEEDMRAFLRELADTSPLREVVLP